MFDHKETKLNSLSKFQFTLVIPNLIEIRTVLSEIRTDFYLPLNSYINFAHTLQRKLNNRTKNLTIVLT